ncbi:MAG TPA: DUF5666 domain-containing protein [Vicinamibacteria bacterium]|nr:DUF5666 domain-containing protein [Vicinamibacteria bacterium]
MNVHSRHMYFFLSALGLGMGAAACGSNAASPTAPGAAAGPAGATLQGTVVGGVAGASAGPGSVHSLSTKAGIQVSVTGTSLVTMTDSSGKFMLTGLPAGPIELHFQGPGINARLTISGLNPGQTLTITVNVNGGQATLEPEGDDGGVEFKGPVQSIDMGAGSLMVGGRKVTTNANTRIVAGDETRVSLSALKVGDTVDVQGTTQPDMSVLAQSIKVEQSGDKDGDKGVDLKGPIQSIDMGAGTLMVAGRKVTTNADTKIVGQDDGHLSFSSLKVGANIQVHGTTQADMSVLAQTIKVQESGGDDGGEAELNGKIQSINLAAGTLVVAGKTVATDSKTRIRRDDSTLTLKDLKVNDSVEVQGTTRTDGTILAAAINLEGGDN